MSESRTTLEMVEEFHKAFGQQFDLDPHAPELSVAEREWMLHAERVLSTLAEDLKQAAGRCDKSVPLLRMHLMTEELGELAAALADEDQVEILDALTDGQYVLDGTYLALGFDELKQAAFEEVHRSNMAKLGPDGKPIIGDSGRVVKPAGWMAPDLKGLLARFFLG